MENSDANPGTGGSYAASSDEKTWAMLAHLSALSGYIIPFGNLIGPLIVWQMKKSEYPLVDDQGKESLNFQISIMIYAVISAILIVVVVGIFLLVAVGLLALIMCIIGAIKAHEGDAYRYPLCIRLIR